MTMRTEDKIKFLFLKKVAEDLKSERTGIHVSDLVYDCLRRAYYGKKYGEVLEDLGMEGVKGLDEATMLTFWIGHKLHEIKLSDMHEYTMEVEGIVGTADEILKIGDEYIILDKKTTRRLPNSPYEHHVKQVEYYSAMFYKVHGINVRLGAILYIDVSNKKSKVFVFKLRENKDSVLKEMIQRKEEIEKALKSDEVPSAKVSWLCDYCSFFEKCVMDGY